jgi:hypothetical protein
LLYGGTWPAVSLSISDTILFVIAFKNPAWNSGYVRAHLHPSALLRCSLAI